MCMRANKADRMSLQERTYMHVCMYACMYVCMYVYLFVCAPTKVLACHCRRGPIYVYACMCIYVFLFMCMCANKGVCM